MKLKTIYALHKDSDKSVTLFAYTSNIRINPEREYYDRDNNKYVINVCENTEQEFEEKFSGYEKEAAYNGYQLKKVNINLEVLLNMGIVGFLIKNLDREIVFRYVSDSYHNYFSLTIQSKGNTVFNKGYKGVYEMLRDKDFSNFLKTGYEYIPLITE